jgi:peptidoglycan/xylan/chitin deacetylase (PgdA/CDA1 family)
VKQQLAARGLAISGLRALISRAVRWSGVIVLNYHRVDGGNSSVFDRGVLSASVDAFVDQIRFCKSHVDLIAPGDLPAVLASRRGRYCLITFDDGYRDNYEIAFPVLKAEGAPATFFVATEYIDVRRVPWWDDIAWMVRTSSRQALDLRNWISHPIDMDEPEREQAVRTILRTYKSIATNTTQAFLEAVAEATGSGRCPAVADLWMDWHMLREMDAAGMTIGGHSVTHPILAHASREVQQAEIVGCGRRLAEQIGKPMRYFSYPVGGQTSFDVGTREVLREAGVQFAFSHYGGFRQFRDWDDYDIRRVAIEPYVTPDWFRSIASLPHLFA